MRPVKYKPKQLVQEQTNREWVYGYIHGVKVWPATWGKPEHGYVLVPDDFDPEFVEQQYPASTNSRIKVRI